MLIIISQCLAENEATLHFLLAFNETNERRNFCAYTSAGNVMTHRHKKKRAHTQLRRLVEKLL